MKKNITHVDDKKCIIQEWQMHRKMKTIRSQNHKLLLNFWDGEAPVE